MDDSTVEILIDVRQRGRENFTEAQAGLDVLRRAVEKFSEMQANGIAVGAAYREGLKALRNAAIEAGLGTEGLKSATNQARNAFAAYMTVIASGLPIEAAMSAALSVDTVEQNRNTEAVNDNRHAYELILPALGGVATAYGVVGLAALKGLNPFAGWLNLLALSVVALGPFVAVMGAATVIVTAFTAGLLGMMAATGGAALMFAGIAVAAFLLADATGKLDVKVGGAAGGAGSQSVSVLSQNFKDLAKSIGERAVPAARELIGWINGGFGTIRTLADGIVGWFSDRLPLVLNRTGLMLRDLLPAFSAFGKFLGDAFDRVMPTIGPMFEMLTRFGLGAVQGLITNLMALSDWFQTRLPTYGPVVSQIFSGIGGAVQGLATNFGKLSDWFVANWPSIKGNLDAFTGGLKDGFDKLNLTFGGPGSVDWKTGLHDLGGALGGVAAIVSDLARVLGILFSQVAAAMPTALANIESGFVSMVNGFVQGINGLITAINNLPGPVKALLGIGGNVGLIPYMQQSGLGGPAQNNSGRAGGNQGIGDSGNVGIGRSSGHKITINVNGAGSPQATAGAVVRSLRSITAV